LKVTILAVRVPGSIGEIDTIARRNGWNAARVALDSDRRAELMRRA
jgi:hypothetical protein